MLPGAGKKAEDLGGELLKQGTQIKLAGIERLVDKRLEDSEKSKGDKKTENKK